MRTISCALMILTVLVLALTGAYPSTRVAASIFPISAIVREIGGDKVDVTTIAHVGSDPHNFELTPSLAKAIHEADIVFMIGGHFDHWALGGEPDANGAKTQIAFHQAFEDSLILIGKSFNPHIWLDPFFAKAMGKIVHMALCTVDLPNCDYYEKRAKVFFSRMDSLHAVTKARLEASGLRDFVAFHPAWTYFARRYGLHETDVIELSTEQEPSARRIARVIENMRQNEVGFILAEEFSNLNLAKGVASETGADIIILDPLGGETRAGRDSYFDLIGYNISQIEEKVSGASSR